MFKNHPKGLLPAALANMGERFGFYTMMAILTLFLMSKFGLDKTNAGIIYSVFYFSIYILAFVGGLIADKTRNYKGTILTGLVIMAAGYLLIAIPTPTPVRNLPLYLTVTCIGLFTIAFGNGLFKGNLQALVGQMYDNEKYGKMRDSGFSLFYMFINVGAIFAPMVAIGVRNWWLSTKGFLYNPDLPELCHGFLGGNLSPEASERFAALAAEVSSNGAPTDMAAFADSYLSAFATGFHYAFGVAIAAMLISLVIFLANKKSLPDPRQAQAAGTGSRIDPGEVRMAAKEVRQRIWALIAVCAVVIFFWFSFHQNGLTLTYFAKDYTRLSIGSLGLSAEIFQSMNPFFVVFLTPLVLAFFGMMRARGKEPSTPAKIAIGMGIAAVAYVVMMLGSLGVPPAAEVERMGGLSEAQRRDAVPADRNLPDSDRCRTVHQPARHLVRVEGRSSPISGHHAGRMARSYGGRQSIAVHRSDFLRDDSDLDDVGRVRRRLPDFDDGHVRYAPLAQPYYEITAPAEDSFSSCGTNRSPYGEP